MYKEFLMYLKNNDVIRKYEMLFDKVFDFESLLSIDDSNFSIIMSDAFLSPVRLYECINNIKIDDKILDYITNLSNEEAIKYSLRLSVSNISNDEKLKYIKSVCLDNSNTIKYAYSLVVNEDLRRSNRLSKYIELIVNSNIFSAVRMRDLILEKDDADTLELCNLLSKTDKEYIMDNMIRLHNFDSTINPIVLLFSKGEIQSKCAYEVLLNKGKIGDEAYKYAYLIANSVDERRSYDMMLSLLKKHDIDCIFNIEFPIVEDLDTIIKSRDLDKLINYVYSNEDKVKKIRCKN